MTALFIHIGGGIPTYLETNLEVFRRTNPNNTVYVCATDLSVQEKIILREYECIVIAPKPNTITERFHIAFKDFLTPGSFKYRCMERYFLIYDILYHYDIDFYIENDVMIFDSLDKIKFTKTFCQKISDIDATSSIMGIERESYNNLCEYFLKVVDETPQIFVDTEGSMTVLNMAIEDGIIDSSNIFPMFDELIFDGASYGQYLGGTHEKEAGATEEAHYVGKLILNKEIHPYFDSELKKPFVKQGEEIYPLFNLHVHSKKLNLFI